MSNVDGIEQVIGDFGKYQTWILCLVTLGRFPAEIQLTNVIFLLPNVDYVCLDDDGFNVTNRCPCENPQFDESAIVSSVMSEWKLICGRSALASWAQSVLHVGILFGSLLFGYISDRYGRKIAVVLSLFSEAVFGSISGIVPDFWTFLVCRFLIGMACGGTILCCYVLIIELSGKSFRSYVIGLIELVYVIGYFFLAIIAYYVREWRYLQLVTSVPWLLVITFFWLLPESPRWLITVRRKREAITILSNIARINGRPTDNVKDVVNAIEKESLTEQEQKNYGNYSDLFSTPKMRIYSMVMALIWLCCSHAFFGINQYIGRLEGNLFLNVILSAVCLIPGLVLVVIASIYLNRKISTMISFVITAGSLLVFVILPADAHTIGLCFAIIGQSAAYMAFVQIYLLASEIFPTVIRNSALGFASVFARLGGFIAPFVVNIGIEWVSIVILSAISLLAAFLCIFLPETKDIVLLNTIKETEEKKTKPDSVS